MPVTNRIVLLDLEETVIDEWAFRNVLSHNLQKIKDSGIMEPNALMGRLQVHLGIMSWAVCDTADAQVVRDELLTPIETALGTTLCPWLPMTMDEYANDVFSARRTRLSREDLYDMFRKEEVLLSLARLDPKFEGKNIFLIDDAVDHGLQFRIPERMCSVTFLNINKPLRAWERYVGK